MPPPLAIAPRPPFPVAWAAKLTVAVLFLGVGLALAVPKYRAMFRPADGVTADFVQEWLSARNFFAGHPIYESQFVSAPRHFPDRRGPITFLEYNAHPPGSVLLALPFAGLSYRDAHFAWNLATTPLLLLAVALAMWELCRPFRAWHLVPVAAVLAWSEPVFATIAYGQLNFVLAFLLTAGWVCERRGWQSGAGAFIGLAAGLKLFPAFLFAYFLFARRWRGLVVGVGTAVAVNAVAVAVFGVGAFEDYVRDVLPSLRPWAESWANDSPSGLWGRLVNPPPLQAGPDAFRSPQLAAVGSVVLALAVAGAVVWASVRARRTGDPDLGWAAAVAALPLVSPVAWQHYFVLHVVPLTVLAARLDGWKRYLGWIAAGGISLRELLYLVLFVSKAHRDRMTPTPPFFLPLSPVEVLLGTGIVTFCGAVLFLLAVTSRPSSSPVGTPSRTS